MKKRTMKELEVMQEELFDKVWYHRYKMSQYKRQLVSKGNPKLIYNEEDHPGFPAAQRHIQKYGIKNLGPYTDFELGVLNGKLAAIRWAMGDEEDNYDS